MEVSLKTDLRFPIPGQQGHGDRIIHELFKLDMERIGIVSKRNPAKVIDFSQYIGNNRGTTD